VIRILYIPLAVAALVLGACAGPSAAGRGGRSGDGSGEPQVSTRAKLFFEDAVKSYEAASKVGAYDYAALERKFKLAADADPNLAEADYNLGVLAERQGKLDEAKGHYESALRKKPSLRQAAENLAVILQNQGDVGGARRMYQQGLENYPDDGGSLARIAELARQQGDLEKATELSREALIRDPRTLTAYKVMIRTSLDRNQLAMAKLVALRATKINADDPELYYLMGTILLKENEREKALLQFKRAVEVRPDYLPAHTVLARMALENQDYTGAEEHLRKILQKDARSAEALVNLGIAYKGMGNYDKALEAYDQAERVNSNLAAIYLNKGVIIHRHKGQPEKGIELYKKYLAMNGDGSSLNGDAPVFGLLKEAEATIQGKEDAKRAEEEAKRMEEEAKRQAAAQKEEEERMKKLQKEEEARIKKMQDEEKAASGTQPASGSAAGKDGPGNDEPKPKKGARKAKQAPAKTAGGADEPADSL
jgi:tetratricopeptide (TPR) repeat protein